MSNDNLPPLPDWTASMHSVISKEMTAYGKACYAAGQRDAVAASGAGVPAGWTIKQHEDGMIFFKRPDDMRATSAPGEALGSHGDTLHMLMSALAAAPTPDRATKAEAAPRNAGVVKDQGTLVALCECGASADSAADGLPGVFTSAEDLFIAMGVDDKSIAVLERDAARWRYVRDTETLETAVWEALEGNGLAPDGVLDQAAYAAGMDAAVDRAIAALQKAPA